MRSSDWSQAGNKLAQASSVDQRLIDECQQYSVRNVGDGAQSRNDGAGHAGPHVVIPDQEAGQRRDGVVHRWPFVTDNHHGIASAGIFGGAHSVAREWLAIEIGKLFCGAKATRAAGSEHDRKQLALLHDRIPGQD